MSVKVMALVWEHGPAKGAERMMLLAVADNADDHGLAWPSVERLATKCCVTIRPARATLRRLERDGWLTIVTGGGKRRGHGIPNRYQIDIKRLTPTRLSTAGVEGACPAVDRGVYPAVSHTSTRLSTADKPSVEPSVEPSLSAAGASSSEQLGLDLPPSLRVVDPPDCTDEWFAAWWAEYPSGPRKVGKRQAREKYGRALAAGADPDMLLAALRRWTPHWAAQDNRYVPQPVRWFNAEHWRPEALPPTVCGDADDGVGFWDTDWEAGVRLPARRPANGH